MKVFKEQQRFMQPIQRLILLCITSIVALTVMIKELLEKGITTEKVFSIVLFLVVISSIIFIFNLKTRIDEHGIYYKFFPFHFSLKKIQWKNIHKVYVRKYSPIMEYGGWGIRLTFNKKGKAFNVSGNIGIQIELKNGKKILIGTQKEKEVKLILTSYSHKIHTQ